MATHDDDRCKPGPCQYGPSGYCFRCGVSEDGERMQHSGRESIKQSHRAEGVNWAGD